jgi:drug/metabolite transporter (DMT)-like permease
VLGLVGACFFWGVGSIYSRYVRNAAEPFTGAAMQQLTAFLWLLLVSVIAGEPGRFDPAAVSRNSFLAWIYLTTAGSLVGFTTFVWLMKHSTPAKVSTYAYVNPVVAVLLGWALLDEPLNGRILGAAAIIVLAVAVITMGKRPPPARVAPAETAKAVEERAEEGRRSAA